MAPDLSRNLLGLLGGANLLTKSTMDVNLFTTVSVDNTGLLHLVVGLAALAALLDMTGMLDLDDVGPSGGG
jgi:hypothetical protein